MLKLIKKIMSITEDMARNIRKSFIVSFFEGIVSGTIFFAILFIFQELLTEGGRVHVKTIAVSSVMIFAGLLIRVLLKILTYKFEGSAGYTAARQIRLDIGNRLKRVPMGIMNESSIGEITNSITNDLKLIESTAAVMIDFIANATIQVVMLSIVMMYFNVQIGLLFLLGVLLAIVVAGIIQNCAKQFAGKQKIIKEKMSGTVLEFIHGIEVFKLFNVMDDTSTDMKKNFEEHRKISSDLEMKMIPLDTIYTCIFKIVIGGILMLTPYLLYNGSMSAVNAVIIIFATFSIFTPLEQAGTMFGMLRLMETSIDSVEILKNLPRIDEISKDVTLHDSTIDFEHVSFSYEEEKGILHDVNFHIPEKSMTAIVGPSGCGKTTLTRLIARFWDVNSGTVKVGGINVKEMTCESLLSNITMVFQNVYLFHDSIYNNIKFGNPNATIEEVKESAKKARCHEFIMSLTDGYETIITEGGGSLSGGEKQRISIARAILKNAPIVLLDEATSSVDPENEVLIVAAIDELVKDKTLVVIAHKLTTVRNANQILVIEKGKIMSRGTHEELMQSDNAYRRFIGIREKVGEWKLV
ncbi:ABC transporter ATP-binding protein/permease [Clostridium estertheticum]|uniref:ABC transporter ATP-binding protein n=1 Tax=Clostridium estertheticum TaxID=238834 RepID=UPI001CF59B08|nr:ABC transporter ATP-binding protein [Clostridium estertheticum]MCB2307632.1 ABC transporter ATP-binding protein/permease [Clostridium estertheticum]MCB2346757.1 ABC transporter ATP-binding protein/permease [Clostridium estertheticum]MCB2351122.1 ABC transporter ATP-binding protein/permease [Clostridium estertheticum]WAG46663.1 ABC transporter ATP-binding protein/permease [Clostridium estertheticum]